MSSSQLPNGWCTLKEVIASLPLDAKVALAISGGGAAGCYEAGVVAGYLEVAPLHARPQFLVGSSAGALNAFAILLDTLSEATPPNPHVAAKIWSNIDARAVVGGRSWLLSALTRWRRWVHRMAIAVAMLFVAAAVVGIFFATIAKWIGHVVPVLVGLYVAATYLFRQSLFANDALRRTLAGATLSPKTRAMRRRDHVRAASEHVVAKWTQLPSAPDLVVTTTDLTSRRECLFALSAPARVQQLADRGWQVAMVGKPEPTPLSTIQPSAFIDALVASTSIPGIFPAQRISVLTPDGKQSHDFVDGGVLNNGPIHVAIDCGATHVISVELEPLFEERPWTPRAVGGELDVAENLVTTFSTVLRETTLTDVRMAAAWNRLLAQPSVVDAVSREGKRPVTLIRVGPAERRIETIEFNGHWDAKLGKIDPTLAAWMAEGRTATLHERTFWNATFNACPDVRPPLTEPSRPADRETV